MQIAPFMDDTLEQLGFKTRKDLSKVMYDNMVKYGGLGLAANQLGLPYRMFIMGGHPEIEGGKVRSVFNPLVNDVSEESIVLKEGCLSFPFLFLSIKRPKWVSVKYTNENNEEIEETLHGMSARIFQHENEHMNGYLFTDLVSKMKLERAEKAKEKMIKEIQKRQGNPKIVH
jgi:peptide deformylase